MAFLRYGNDSCFEIELADGRLASEVGVPRAQPLADAAAATAAALADPLDYPPLARSTTPADRIVLALDRGVPQAAEVVAAIVQTLVHSGVDPDGVVVLRSPSDCDARAEDPCRLLPAALRQRVALMTHDPADRRQLAYLAASESGEAILLNRALHDADVVLPVGCLHGDQATGYFGIHSAVYPTFSNAKTLERFRGLASLNSGGARKRELAAEADNVAWLLGVNFTVQLLPAGGGQALDVLAGQSESVRRQGRELYRAAWDWPVSRQAGLVVATVEGAPLNRLGKTWAGPSRPPAASPRKGERSPSVATWPAGQAPPCNILLIRRRVSRRCGRSTATGPPTPCRPPNSRRPWTATRSTC